MRVSRRTAAVAAAGALLAGGGAVTAGANASQILNLGLRDASFASPASSAFARGQANMAARRNIDAECEANGYRSFGDYSTRFEEWTSLTNQSIRLYNAKAVIDAYCADPY